MTDANDITTEPSAMDRLDTAGAMLLACGARSIASVGKITEGLLCGMWQVDCEIRRHGHVTALTFVSRDRDAAIDNCAAWIMATRDELVGAGRAQP